MDDIRDRLAAYTAGIPEGSVHSCHAGCTNRAHLICDAEREIATLTAERDRLAAQLTICKQQADQGLEVEHDCPAMYACACIYAELTTDDERAAIDAALQEKRDA